MARFLDEPSHQHGLAFIRPDNKVELAFGTKVEGYQAGDHDLVHVGAHLDISNEFDIQKSFDVEEKLEVGNEETEKGI
jgi:hypothetical protein